METSLAIMTNAAKMLSEATTIQKTKELKDLALTAADWAKRKGLGEETIRYCMTYAFEAERRMGELLKGTERNKGTRAAGKDNIGSTIMEPPNNIPTLSELGLTKKESSTAQFLASIPEETFEKIASGKMSAHEAQKEMRLQQRTEARAEVAQAGALVEKSEKWNIYHADIRTWKAVKQYDFIITDPPYPREFLPLWSVLAQRAKELLKPGGLLIAMSGQSYLDEIYSMMSEHMKYYWTACYLTPGQPTPLRHVNVNTTWKPLLIYSNGDYSGKIFGDVTKSEGNDKDFHKWGQSESGMDDIISRFCLPGQSILDPFCGAGTTGIAAINYGCFFDGLDIEIDNVNISKARLNDTEKAR